MLTSGSGFSTPTTFAIWTDVLVFGDNNIPLPTASRLLHLLVPANMKDTKESVKQGFILRAISLTAVTKLPLISPLQFLLAKLVNNP